MNALNKFFSALDDLTDYITVAALFVFGYGLVLANPIWIHHPAFYVPMGIMAALFTARVAFGFWQGVIQQPMETEEIDLDAEVPARVE